MLDIALNDQHDLAVPAYLVDDAEHVRQSLRIRLQAFRGEWFLDIFVGVPYYQQVFMKQRKGVSEVDAVFKDAILQAPGVTSLVSYQSTFIDRQYRATFSVATVYGEASGQWPV